MPIGTSCAIPQPQTATTCPSATHKRDTVSSMFDRCSAGIYRYITLRVGHDRDIADEVMQQLWYHVCRSNKEVPSDEFEYWLRGIAKNLIADHWRRLKRRPAHVPFESPGIANELSRRLDATEFPEEVLHNKEVREQLALAITELPAADQDLIIRHYVHGEPFADMGCGLGLSERAVEGRLYRARQKLKSRLAHLER